MCVFDGFVLLFEALLDVWGRRKWRGPPSPSVLANVCGFFLFNISCNCFKILTCSLLSLTESGSFNFRTLNSSAAAAIILSPSEMVGGLQCAGYNRKVPVAFSPPALGSKKRRRR